MSEVLKKVPTDEVVETLYNDLRSRVEAVEPNDAIVAPDYADLTLPILVGTRCTHNRGLYKCNTQINSSEAWTAAHWDEITVGSELDTVNSQVIVSASQPQESNNKLWIKNGSGDEYTVPTYAEHQALLNDIQGANEKVKAVNDLENDLIKDAEWKEGTVDPETGGDAWSNSRLLSDYIVINEYKTITVTVDDGYKYMIALVNSAKTAIVNTLAWSTNKTVIDLSDYSTAKYIRLVLQKTDNTLPSSAEYVHATFATELLEVLDNKVSKGEVSYDTLANDMKGIFTYKYNEEPETLNFANTNSLLLSNGNLLSYTGNYAVTDYIDCSNWRSMKYSGRWYYDGQCLAFYDENKTFISAFPGTTSNYHDYVLEVITIPQNAKYVRIAKCIIDTSVYIAVNIVPAKAGFKWIGKKWVCIGDSLTEVNATAKKRYHDFVAENTGISVVNLGVSGTGYMNGGSGGNNPFRARVSSIPLDADVITIFGSFNDLGNDFPIGTKTDTGTSTVGGCINTTLDDICTRITIANIGIVTPTPWANAYPLDANTSGQAYVQLLKDICYARGIPCLDLNHCSQLRPWDASFKAAAYSNDNTGVHPDENGHRLIAPRFEAFLDELLLV